LLDADQFAALWLLRSPPSAKLQFQTCAWLLAQSVFALILLLVPKVNCAGFVQLHGTETVLAGPLKLKELSWQSLFGMEMLTCEDCPGRSIPANCEKSALCKLLLAAQAILLSEPEVWARVAVQVQPFPLAGQLVPAVKLVGLIVSDVCPGVQCHGTRMVLAGPVKVKAAAAGQVVFGTEIVTCADLPGNNVPCEELNLMPLIPLLDALHCRLL